MRSPNRYWLVFAILLGAVALAVWERARGESFPSPNEFIAIERYLDTLHDSEASCLETTGDYCGIGALAKDKSASAVIGEAMSAGYKVEVNINTGHYSLVIVPNSAKKKVSMYSDETKRLHLAFGSNARANQDSAVWNVAKIR